MFEPISSLFSPFISKLDVARAGGFPVNVSLVSHDSHIGFVSIVQDLSYTLPTFLT